MDTRVGMQTLYQNTLAATQQITAKLTTLNAQAATGQQFANVSDDPTAALSILSHGDVEQRLGAHLGNIQTATTALNTSVSALQQVNDIFSQAKAIGIEASSSVNDPTAFTALAQQVNSLINNLVSVANTQNNGTYVFGGGASTTRPYDVTSQDAAGNIQGVSYKGDSAGTSAIVADGQQVELYYPGNQIFQQQNRQPATFQGSTGATPGTGIDSATGQATLTISHTATSFAPGAGIQPGDNSVAGDTILGPAGAHSLQIQDTSGNGSAGTISLDGGPPVSFTSAATNLKVTNAAGDTVFLNTTAITPGYSGNVAITADGSMSIDGGATQTPLTFATDQSATDGKTSAVTFIDTSKVMRTGTESIKYPGTGDAFQTLFNLRDLLNNVTKLSSADQIKAISNQLGELDNTNQQVLQSMGQQSATLQSLTSLQTHLKEVQLSTQETISTESGADVTKVVVQLQSYEQMLQLSLEAFAQIHSISLLNYLPASGS